MTKKHYEAIARIIDIVAHDKHKHPHNVAYYLATYFEQDNPKFNRDRFLRACGVIEDKYCHECMSTPCQQQ